MPEISFGAPEGEVNAPTTKLAELLKRMIEEEVQDVIGRYDVTNFIPADSRSLIAQTIAKQVAVRLAVKVTLDFEDLK